METTPAALSLSTAWVAASAASVVARGANGGGGGGPSETTPEDEGLGKEVDEEDDDNDNNGEREEAKVELEEEEGKTERVHCVESDVDQEEVDVEVVDHLGDETAPKAAATDAAGRLCAIAEEAAQADADADATSESDAEPDSAAPADSSAARQLLVSVAGNCAAAEAARLAGLWDRALAAIQAELEPLTCYEPAGCARAAVSLAEALVRLFVGGDDRQSRRTYKVVAMVTLAEASAAEGSFQLAGRSARASGLDVDKAFAYRGSAVSALVCCHFFRLAAGPDS